MNEYIESCHREKHTYDEEGVREAVRLFLKSIGEDPEREGLVETPDRIARACRELFAGLQASPADVLEKHFDVDTDELVLVKDIELYSVCEHHLLPFHGVAHVELAGDVGGRHDDGIGLLFGIPDAGEALVFLPLLINSAFHLMGVIDLGQFFSHSGFSSITLQHSGSLAPEADFFSGFWGIVSPQNSWIGSWVCWPMKALKDIASPVVKPALSRMMPWLMSKKMTYQFWSDTTAKACS